ANFPRRGPGWRDTVAASSVARPRNRTRPAGGPTRRGRPSRYVLLAARWVDEGRRLDMQGLADELGVSRATLFRHVGSREALLGAALAVLTDCTLECASRRWEAERPSGELHTPGTGRYINEIVSESTGLRRLLDDEPALTL